jgi:hypothetical protein
MEDDLLGNTVRRLRRLHVLVWLLPLLYAGCGLAVIHYVLMPDGRSAAFEVNSSMAQQVLLGQGLVYALVLQPLLHSMRAGLHLRLERLPLTRDDHQVAAHLLNRAARPQLLLADLAGLLGAFVYIGTGDVRHLVLGILASVVFHAQIFPRLGWLPSRYRRR